MKVCVYVSLALRDERRLWDVLFYCFCIPLIFSHSLTWRGGHDKRCQPQSLQKFAISSKAMAPQLQNCDADANFTASPGELKMAAVPWFTQSRCLINGSISAIIKCIYGTNWSLSCYNTRIVGLHKKYYWCLLKTYGFRLPKSHHHKRHAHTHTHTHTHRINWFLCIGARFKYLIFSLFVKMPPLRS